MGSEPLNADLTYRVGCKMTGGSSGGPWFTSFSAGSGTLMSVNSSGYPGVAAMEGPRLNATTSQMLAVAATATATATGDTIVP